MSANGVAKAAMQRSAIVHVLPNSLQLVHWMKVLLKKLIGLQLVIKFPACFWKTAVQCSQEPESVESSPYPHVISLRFVFIHFCPM
jgi:hypothetical protein